MVDWSIEKDMVDVKILSISYPNLLNSINRLIKIVSIKDNTDLIENVFHELLLL